MRLGWVERGTIMIRLTRPHFSFFRGYLEGLDVRELAERYLETSAYTGDPEIDLRIAKSSLKWIGDQLVIAARRASIPSASRLLSITPDKLHVAYEPDVPSLEEFREDEDPYGAFSERELIELFNEKYGRQSVRMDRRTVRNKRLRGRQAAALVILEGLVAADPKLENSVDAWIDPVLAKRLTAVDIRTLGDLVAFINRYGYRWYSKVPRIGELAANQITKWLTTPSVAEPLGNPVEPRALIRRSELALLPPPVMTPRTDIVPLERFLIPSRFDGSNGTNRGTRSLLNASNDLDAINAWLKNHQKPGTANHTVRAYRKEAERFLLWSILVKEKPLSSLSHEDCLDYRDFLWHLGRTTRDALSRDEWLDRYKYPHDRWIGSRHTRRDHPDWRPFDGQLSESSQKMALTVVQRLFEWLVSQDYLHGNPMKGISHLAARSTKFDSSRALTEYEWKTVLAYLSTMDRDERSTRIRFILVFAYRTGLRLSELATLTAGQLKPFTRAGEATLRWSINVKGKGGSPREIPLNPDVVALMREYFATREHNALEEVRPEIPIISALPLKGAKDGPLSAYQMYRLVKRFFYDVADSLDATEFALANRIREASTHWLRHTFATHALQKGMSLEVVRGLLGHKSLDTTSVYINTERDRASIELEQFFN